jgi:hypothetical protein
MELTRCQMFAMPAARRQRIYAKRLVSAKAQHARWSANRLATQLVADGVVDGVTYRGRFDWSVLDALTLAGYKLGVQATLARQYRVHPGLLEYGSRVVAAKMGCNEDLTVPNFTA